VALGGSGSHAGVMLGDGEVARTRLGAVLDAAARAFGLRPVDSAPRAVGLEQVCARLHRLEEEIAGLLMADPRTPALYHRLHAASLAYDAVLAEACQVLGLPRPGAPPLDGPTRLQAEAALTAAGLRW
jgi:hypothetical protein